MNTFTTPLAVGSLLLVGTFLLPATALADDVADHVANLADAEPPTRAAAALDLSRLGADAAPAVPALRTALGDASLRVRRLALVALGEIGPAARPALDDLWTCVLTSEDLSLRATGWEVLSELSPMGDLVSRIEGSWEAGGLLPKELFVLLDVLGEAIVPLITRAVTSESQAWRIVGARVVAEFPSKHQVTFEGQFSDPGDDEPEAADEEGPDEAPPRVLALDEHDDHCRELAWTLPQALVQGLATMLREEREHERSYALTALGEIGAQAKPAIGALATLLTTDVGQQAFFTLAELDDLEPAESALIAALNGSNDLVRQGVPELLRKLPSAQATAALLAALEHDDPAVRREAAFVLADRAGDVRVIARALLALLKREGPPPPRAGAFFVKGSDPRQVAAYSLEQLARRDPNAVAEVAQDLNDLDLQEAVGQILERAAR